MFSYEEIKKAEERIRRLNPAAVILPVSAKTGEGLDELENWLLTQMRQPVRN